MIDNDQKTGGDAQQDERKKNAIISVESNVTPVSVASNIDTLDDKNFNGTYSRRKLLAYGGAASLAAVGLGLGIRSLTVNAGYVPPGTIPVPDRPKELAYLAPLVDAQSKWGPGELFKFLNGVSDKQLEPYGQSLDLDMDEFGDLTRAERLGEIHEQILWLSSSIFSYPFKSVENINYHNVVVWVANKVGIPKDEARFTTTFDLEKRILEQQFVAMWDKLDDTKRAALLDEIDPSGREINSVSIAGMSGAAALATLSTSVYFAGFAFYSTMSTVLCAVAGWVGVTLPFAAYTTVSSTVAILSGPVGWAIGAVFLAGALAVWAGQADVRQTTATVMQIHCMKAGALYGVGKI